MLSLWAANPTFITCDIVPPRKLLVIPLEDVTISEHRMIKIPTAVQQARGLLVGVRHPIPACCQSQLHWELYWFTSDSCRLRPLVLQLQLEHLRVCHAEELAVPLIESSHVVCVAEHMDGDGVRTANASRLSTDRRVQCARQVVGVGDFEFCNA